MVKRKSTKSYTPNVLKNKRQKQAVTLEMKIKSELTSSISKLIDLEIKFISNALIQDIWDFTGNVETRCKFCRKCLIQNSKATRVFRNKRDTSKIDFSLCKEHKERAVWCAGCRKWLLCTNRWIQHSRHSKCKCSNVNAHLKKSGHFKLTSVTCNF
jgi:hypothetical protein